MDRLLDAPRTRPGEAALGPALDALGGEVVRLRSRDGLRLAAAGCRPADPTADWTPDPHEAILLLHGYSGSIAPDLVEYGAVPAPDGRASSGSTSAATAGRTTGRSTFGLLEIEDVAGALAWLGERGITRVALVGTSMGGIAAIAAVAVLGDGSLAAADGDPDGAARRRRRARARRSSAVVADSVAPELEVPVATRVRGPAGALRRRPPVRRRDARARAPIRARPSRSGSSASSSRSRCCSSTARPTRPCRSRTADGWPRSRGRAAEHWVVPGAGPQRQPRRSRPRTTSGGSRTSCALRSGAGAARMSVRPGPAL